ncbi:uncharacterized protein LOC142977711 [Anticarsia gemmatalis]|uniref:uncharacterized protein LOC142977711 n=1 Tax=Anticarsia gemmatalis TaxID=129554 RepID=UPI003F762F53
MASVERVLLLEDILNGVQISHILEQVINEPYVLQGSEVRPAMDGIAGFLGDHIKAALHVEVGGEMKKVQLFIKRIPMKDKEFIEKNNYFRKEKLMFEILEEIRRDGPTPWCVKAYIYTDSIFVMPDLSIEGYSTRHYLDTLDSKHVFLATTSLARFHAGFVNYETKKTTDVNPYRTSQEYGHLLIEPTFADAAWPKSCAKLSVNLLKNFSRKLYSSISDLEPKMADLYVKAYSSLKEYEDTLNILLHKDLWVNNIMFKYENIVPIDAVLIDFQCLRYGPPAFDIVAFLYLTTDRKFREEHEKEIFDHYYSIFIDNLSEESKKRLEGLGYDKESFLDWCEKARMFGLLEAVGMFPHILMDPETSETMLDDPGNGEDFQEDWSEPVIEYATKCEVYRNRNLEISEEFVERYLLE